MYVTVCINIQSLSTLVVAHKKHSPSAPICMFWA